MSETPPNEPGHNANSEPGFLKPGNERNMAAMAHGLGIPFPIIAPLLIWLTQKDSMPAIEPACKEALNFQITFHGIFIMLALITCIPTLCLAPLACLTVPVLSLIMLGIIIMQIIATMAALSGKPYRYPIRIELIK